MYEQKSAVAALLRQISLEYEVAVRRLTSLSAGRTKHSFITTELEQARAYHEQLACVIAK